MDAGYRKLPPVYDRWQRTYGKNFSELILPRLLSAIRAHRIPGQTMVDIACGTGTLALMMARRGWQVTGIDASAGMLACASAKAGGKHPPVHFLHQDMRSVRLPRPVHLATSFFDSLNHLLESDDLLLTFRSTAASLLPGGWFIFDMNNELCFTTLWTKSETIAHRDFIMRLENGYDKSAGIATCAVTITMKDQRDPPTLTETVRERLYQAGDVRRMLRDAGFAVRESEEFNFTTNPEVGRIKTWWVAEKE